MTTHFKNGPDGWPAWLAEEARLNDPERTLGHRDYWHQEAMSATARIIELERKQVQ